MATTTPFPFAAYYDAAAHDAAHNAHVAQLTEWYESNLADSDKAADGYDAGNYGGAADAYFDALVLLTGVDVAIVKAYHDGQDVTPVSPANDEVEIRILPSVMHVDDQHYDEAHEHMTGDRDDRYGGYTLMPSGWQMYSGPRLVKVECWDAHGTRVASNLIEHAQIMRILQDHLNEVGQAHGNPVDDAHYDMVEAVMGLVLSDAQTGTSIMHWPVMNRLVDRALTAATTEELGWHVTSEWEEF